MKKPDEPLVSDTPITDAGCAMVYLASGSAFEAADPEISRKLERDLAGALRESEDRNQQWAAKSIYASQLERDLAEETARARTAEAMIQMSEQQLGNAMVVGQGTLIDKIANVMRAGRAQSEALDEAKAELRTLKSDDDLNTRILTQHSEQIAELQEERRELEEQLTAHKAALEKCEQALGRMVPCQFRDQALSEIAKLRGGAK